MDLDKIKETWDKINIHQDVEDQKIKDIIRSRARTAIDKLRILEATGMIIILPLISLPFLLPDAASFFDGAVKWIYVLFCVLGSLWQAYKFFLLKRINLLKAGIIECSKYILKYRLCLKFEILFSSLFVLLFNIILLYSKKNAISAEKILTVIGICVIFWLFIGVILFLLYKFLYFNQIRRIESALNEIESLEKENE